MVWRRCTTLYTSPCNSFLVSPKSCNNTNLNLTLELWGALLGQSAAVIASFSVDCSVDWWGEKCVFYATVCSSPHYISFYFTALASDTWSDVHFYSIAFSVICSVPAFISLNACSLGCTYNLYRCLFPNMQAIFHARTHPQPWAHIRQLSSAGW